MSTTRELELFARYPWSESAANYIRDQNLELETLVDPSNRPVLEFAVQRILKAISSKDILPEKSTNFHEICISFPVARMLIELLHDDALRHRFAVQESKRASSFLQQEDEGTLRKISINTFHWTLVQSRYILDNQIFNYQMPLIDYIHYSPLLQSPFYKLVNKVVNEGQVYLDNKRLIRLIEETVKQKIIRTPFGKKGLDSSLTKRLKELFAEEITQITEEWGKIRQTWGAGEFTGEAWIEGFPPCVRELLALTREGQNISHLGRFTLASYLLHIGLSTEDILDLFRKAPDFQQDLAKYQIQHISGETRGGKRYTPPMCATLQTNQLCRAGDDSLCRSVKHPLGYYRIKLRYRKQKPSQNKPERK